MGAVAAGEMPVLNQYVIEALKIPDRVIEAVTSRELHELGWRERAYRANRPPHEVRGGP